MKHPVLFSNSIPSTPMKSIMTSNGFEFFFKKEDAFNAAKEGYAISAATYSSYYDKAIVNRIDYAKGTEEYLIGNGECDAYGYVVVKAEGLIFNATQHEATVDQLIVGVANLEGEALVKLKQALTFGSYYTNEDLVSAANTIQSLLYKAWDSACHKSACADELAQYPDDSWQNHWYHTPKKCMIGGMPSLMPVLERVLKSAGWEVGYACSERVSVDQHMPDGSVKKVNSFKHVGFYWA